MELKWNPTDSVFSIRLDLPALHSMIIVNGSCLAVCVK